MNRLITSFILVNVILASLFSSGCSHFSLDYRSFLGTSIKDLEQAKSSGKEKDVSLSYDDAFNSVTDILISRSITIYQSNMTKGYIIAMGFPRQTNTTRVGIFFDSIADNRTKITLSSLSHSALLKAEAMIFSEIN